MHRDVFRTKLFSYLCPPFRNRNPETGTRLARRDKRSRLAQTPVYKTIIF